MDILFTLNKKSRIFNSLKIIRFPRIVLAIIIFVALVAHVPPLIAQEVFLGEIDLVPYNFAMTGFAECNGQLLSISQNTALFSLLGTMYGGNGISTFALPDLRDRTPIHAGQGPGLSNYDQGQTGGESAHTLLLSEMPVHNHTFNVDSTATSDSPVNNLYSRNAAAIPTYSGSHNTTMNPGAIGTSGGSQPHNNLQPYLGLKYVIATQGIYPPRN